MKQRPAIYLITGLFNGLVALAMLALGGILIYEAAIRFSSRGFSNEELWIGMGFAFGGLCIAWFVATTLRRSTTQAREVVLDHPDTMNRVPQLSGLQKATGVLAILSSTALAALAVYLYYSLVMERQEFDYTIPTQTIVAMTIMLMIGVLVPLYVVGTWRRSGKHITTH